MPGSARPCSTGLPIRPTLSKQVRSRTAFAEPCERNAKSDPWRPPFHSASASPYGLRSSRTELYPLNLQRPRVGQIKPPKWAKPTCQKHKLYHLGFRGKVARSTLADANESRDWRIFADFAQRLITIARGLYVREPMGVDLEQSLYALDSTTIDLCLALFPWARFRRRKAAVKLHTLLDLRGNIPTFIRVTSGVVHDVNLLDEIMPEAGAFYVMDRAYVDFQRLFVFTLSSAFFVVRTKSNVLLQRRYSHPVDKSTGVRSDHIVILSSFESASVYPYPLRRVSYCDAETGKRLKFLTNNFTLPALTIAQIYKQRWQVELFFKWIKQHLRIKAFYAPARTR